VRKAQRGVAAEVRAYLAAQPPPARRALQTVRAAIREAAPRAVEHFSYRMPGFRLDGRPLVWYAGFKAHVSLFPVTADIRRDHAAALKGYTTSTGTIQFPLDEPMPVALIKRLVRTRVRTMQAPHAHG
jgi:uncharacterized protein YdhG (YjbR/CyaY superfamily)